MRTGLHINPAVARRLTPTTLDQLDHLRHQTYICPKCQVEGTIGADDPANLLVISDAPISAPIIDTSPHVTILRFAHQACMPSQLIYRPTQALVASLSPEQSLTTSVWIRPH